jgi:hypothetical protein
MKLLLSLVVAGSLLAFPGVVQADDHHFQAITSGALTFDLGLGQAVNKADHAIPDSPGQASPFTGNHQCTPATDTEAAHENANVKAKGADDISECEEAD